MIYNNGAVRGHTHWLDMALASEPPETKARVLEIILKYGIDPDNEFFILFVALGQLQVLVEDAPKDWNQVFETFEGDLTTWSESNLETLRLMAKKAESTAHLALYMQQLSDTLRILTNNYAALTQHSTSSTTTLVSSVNSLQALTKTVSKASAKLLEDNTVFHRQALHHLKVVEKRQRLTLIASWVGVGVGLLTLICILKG